MTSLHLDTESQQRIDQLLNSLGLPLPNQYELYQRALVHSSYTYENQLPSLENYERLEFLGDAVLKLLVSEYIFELFPQAREGELTKIRAVVVSDAVLAPLARAIDLGKYMVFGQSEAKSKGAQKSSNLACGFEALLGALFLDGRQVELKTWLRSLLNDQIQEVAQSKTKDNYKAVLQELTQAQGQGLPIYQTRSEQGPSHNKTFSVEVMVQQELLGHGEGKTKKEAQQNAAKMALETLNHS